MKSGQFKRMVMSQPIDKTANKAMPERGFRKAMDNFAKKEEEMEFDSTVRHKEGQIPGGQSKLYQYSRMKEAYLKKKFEKKRNERFAKEGKG